MDDEDLIREIVPALIDDTASQVLLLAAAIQDRDSNRCTRLAHSSKGACANLGANAMAAVFQRVEQTAGSGDFSRSDDLLTNVLTEFNRLRQEAEDISGAGRRS